MAKTETGLRSIADSRGEMLRVDPRKLNVEPGWNSREESPELDAHIDMLAQSIKEVGVREPLRVVWKDGQAYVRSGHCRLRGALRAIEHYQSDLKTVPVINEDRYSSDADQVLGQIVDNSGKPLTAFETAKVFKRLMDLGWQAKDIAAKCGKSQAHVSQILDYLLLPANIKEMVLRGEVSATLAIQTYKSLNEDAGATAAKLKEAVDTAHSSGRNRAMPKDMTGEKPVPVRQFVRTIFEGADVIKPDGDDGIVMIRMTMEDWQAFSERFGLDITPGQE